LETDEIFSTEFPVKKAEAKKSIQKRVVDKVPVYIGIAAEADKDFSRKLKNMFVEGFDQMGKKFPEQAKMFANMKKTVLELIKILIND